jgi:predicted DsbA family dithiol-disulfide isomerase
LPGVLEIEVFIDLICPRCYVAVRRLADALARFGHQVEVEVVWRSFQLAPGNERSFDELLVQAVMRNHRMTRVDAVEVVGDVHARLVEAAADEGLLYDPAMAGPIDTFAAHRMLHLAAARGLCGAAVQRIQRAYFAEGMPIGHPGTLAMLLAEVGVDHEEARSVALGDAFEDAVHDNRDRAEQRGISSVPFFLFDERLAVSGAQSAWWLLMMMRRCWDAHSAEGR